jgi:hypothetical protein
MIEPLGPEDIAEAISVATLLHRELAAEPRNRSLQGGVGIATTLALTVLRLAATIETRDATITQLLSERAATKP